MTKRRMSLLLPRELRSPLPARALETSRFSMMVHKVASVRERRERLDCALVARGLAESREQAAGLILAGAVKVDGVPAAKQAKLRSEGVV